MCREDEIKERAQNQKDKRLRWIGKPVDSKYNLTTLLEKLENYVIDTEYPILSEFYLKEKLAPSTVTHLEFECVARQDYRLTDLIEFLNKKREVWLERQALAGNIDTKFAMFVLKQRAHGWSDKIEVDSVADVNLNLNVKFT